MSAALAMQFGCARGQSLDITLDPINHNILCDKGYAFFVSVCLSLLSYAFSWWGPPCGLWIWLSTGTTLRAASNTCGDLSKLVVRNANAIVERMTTLLKLLTLRLVQYIVEQPMTSLMFRYRSFSALEGFCARHNKHLQKLFLWLGWWGGATPKPSKFIGMSPLLSLFRGVSKRPGKRGTSLVTKTTLKTVTRRNKQIQIYRVSGNRKLLKLSGVYPKKFCHHVAQAGKLLYLKRVCSMTGVW